MDIALGNATDMDGNANEVWSDLQMVVDKLQPDGMSSDESEPEERGKPTTYLVRRMAWRNKQITKMLKIIDGDRNITNAYGNRRSGNPPRARVRRGGWETRREAPPGLPINFYDDKWYQALSNGDKRSLRAEESVELREIEDM